MTLAEIKAANDAASARNATLRRIVESAAELEAAGEPFPDVFECLRSAWNWQHVEEFSAKLAANTEDCRPEAAGA